MDLWRNQSIVIAAIRFDVANGKLIASRIIKTSCDEEEAMLSLAAHMHDLLQNGVLSFLLQGIAAVGIDQLWL